MRVKRVPIANEGINVTNDRGSGIRDEKKDTMGQRIIVGG